MDFGLKGTSYVIAFLKYNLNVSLENCIFIDAKRKESREILLSFVVIFNDLN